MDFYFCDAVPSIYERESRDVSFQESSIKLCEQYSIKLCELPIKL